MSAIGVSSYTLGLDIILAQDEVFFTWLTEQYPSRCVSVDVEDVLPELLEPLLELLLEMFGETLLQMFYRLYSRIRG